MNIRCFTEENPDNVSMTPAIRGIQRLAWCDRLLLLILVLWGIGGIQGNYLLQHHRTDGTAVLLYFATIFLWAATTCVVAWSVFRRQRRPADYGFSFGTGGVLSLAVLAVIHVYLVISGKLVLSATESYLQKAAGAFIEELLFRAVAINVFLTLMDGIKAKAFWAIVASSALWSLPHIPSKPLEQLLGGIFLGGLLFGYVYYKTKSILLPAWLHIVANSGYLAGIWIAGLYCLIGFADWAIWSSSKQNPPAVAAQGTSPLST